MEIEMDSKIIHKEILRQKGGRLWKVWSVVRDIKCLLNKIVEKKVVLVRRNANSVADWIAT